MESLTCGASMMRSFKDFGSWNPHFRKVTKMLWTSFTITFTMHLTCSLFAKLYLKKPSVTAARPEAVFCQTTAVNSTDVTEGMEAPSGQWVCAGDRRQLYVAVTIIGGVAHLDLSAWRVQDRFKSFKWRWLCRWGKSPYSIYCVKC